MAGRRTHQDDEAGFQQRVIELAQLRGWLVAHFTRAMLPNGHWLTPVKANGKGFPDLVLVRERVIFAELKAKGGVVSPDQRVWLDRLRDAGAEVYLWRASEWGDIQKVLARPPTT